MVKTTLTDLLGINNPIILAGMAMSAGPKLAAAVTNAGVLGVIGGVGYTPEIQIHLIDELKADLNDKSAPFGVDLLLLQVGGNARKTNYDYTKGKLDELIDMTIEKGAKLFVSAVGLPARHIMERLHKAGILYMNMVDHPKRVTKALENGADIVCAKGGEGSGHTGTVPTSILIPAVARLCSGRISSSTGIEVQVVADGGMYISRSLVVALQLGATGIWVGTRFITAKEAGASRAHQDEACDAGFDSPI